MTKAAGAEAAPATADQAAPGSGAEPALRVRSAQPSRRRAGYEFTQAPRDLRLGDLSEEQVEGLLSDPVLMVERVTILLAPSRS